MDERTRREQLDFHLPREYITLPLRDSIVALAQLSRNESAILAAHQNWYLLDPKKTTTDAYDAALQGLILEAKRWIRYETPHLSKGEYLASSIDGKLKLTDDRRQWNVDTSTLSCKVALAFGDFITAIEANGRPTTVNKIFTYLDGFSVRVWSEFQVPITSEVEARVQ